MVGFSDDVWNEWARALIECLRPLVGYVNETGRIRVGDAELGQMLRLQCLAQVIADGEIRLTDAAGAEIVIALDALNENALAAIRIYLNDTPGWRSKRVARRVPLEQHGYVLHAARHELPHLVA